MNRATTNFQITVIGVASLLLIGGALWFGTGRAAPIPPTGDQVIPQAVDDPLTVHVSGSVLHPGVVTVTSDARVADAVRAAGGATRDADLRSMNLAGAVRDGEHIDVPSLNEASPSPGGGPSGVDLNQASASELQVLPGVGPVLADRIATFREENGPFLSVEDLLDVPGIGEAKLASLRDAISSP